MGPLSLSRSLIRIAFCAVLLIVPALSAWNLVVPPSEAIQIGPKLKGVTRDTLVTLSWGTLRDGSFQKAMASHVTEALALRPLLIRVNNELLVQSFGIVTAPNVFQGANGQLTERSYLDEYCARTEGQGDRLAADIIPGLRDIQAYYRARGRVFFYLVTPSKVAHLPEYFVGRVPCPSTPAARTEFVPRYVARLRQAGIDVVDAASLIHATKGKYEVELFPQGGVHWNDIGGAQATLAIVAEINRQAGRELVPPFSYTYTLSKVRGGVDRELADVLNVLFPPLGYVTPKVTIKPSATCSEHPARLLDVAFVGSSFVHLPAEILIDEDCLTRLNHYFYLTTARFGGHPYRALQSGVTETDFQRLRDADIMILEENESFAGRSAYVAEMQRILARR